jgi:hypothetical protein
MIYDPLKISRWTLFKTFKNLIAAVDWAVDRSHANSGLIVGEEVERVASSNADPESSGSWNQHLQIILAS